jgi:N-acetylglucosaminyldiphosphoundecaprenol N-acetyl-beta-D-mannosaminyltransferase
MNLFSLKKIKLFKISLNLDLNEKLLITTLNAHSYNIAQSNLAFAEALKHSNVLLPDGISIVWAKRFLDGTALKKIAGADLFHYEMNRLNESQGSCFFLGSTPQTLQLIQAKAALEFPHVKVETYSPPFKDAFNDEDNALMLAAIRQSNPDALFIGMTAPKQELWAYEHFKQIQAKHICCIGAVFDFYAGTTHRAPQWLITLGLEWLFRFVSEPKRLWKRYLIGNTQFIFLILKEKFRSLV